DARTDVYGLGAVLYAMLAGRPPFDGASMFAVLDAVMTRPPEPLEAFRRDAPAWLVRVVERAMAKAPEERFQEAAALAAALATPGGASAGRRSPVPALIG